MWMGVGRRAVPARGSVGVSCRAKAMRGSGREPPTVCSIAPCSAGSRSDAMAKSRPTATCSTVGTSSAWAASSESNESRSGKPCSVGGPVGSAMSRNGSVDLGV